MIASGREVIEDAMGGATEGIQEEAGGVDVVGVHLLQGVSEAVVGAAPTVEVEEAVGLPA
jgi:hypothetical protein